MIQRMVMNKGIFIVLLLVCINHNGCTVSKTKKNYKNMNLSIKNFDGLNMSFTVIDWDLRQQILKTGKYQLYKIDKSFVGDRNIYELENGHFLFLYTFDAYAFLFTKKAELDLFLHNDNHFTISVIRDNPTHSFYYKILLFCEKVAQLLKVNPNLVYIEGFPTRSPMMDFKLVQLQSGGYLRFYERAKGVYDGDWFPDLANFEYYYHNQYCD